MRRSETDIKIIDETPWTPGAILMEPDKRKLELAVERFWSNTQLGYDKGKVIRTDLPRVRPALDLFVKWKEL